MDPTVVEESVCTAVPPPSVDASNSCQRGQMTLAFMGNLKQVSMCDEEGVLYNCCCCCCCCSLHLHSLQNS